VPGLVEPTKETTSSTSFRTALEGAADVRSEQPTNHETDCHQEIAATEATSEEQLAEQFANTFEPTNGVSYEWVCGYAKECYGTIQTAFKELEDKASSAITFLGSGAGLLTMGAAVAVANPSVDRTVAEWSIPSIIAALVALVFALKSRWTMACTYPPPINEAIALANYAITEERSKAIFAAQIHQCVMKMLPVLARKAFWVEWCLRLAVVAVVLMLLPLFAALSIPRKPEPLPIPAAKTEEPVKIG